MEQAQRQYFLQRLEEITREKLQAKAVELFGESGRPEQPTWGMVFDAIKEGKIFLKEDKVGYTGPYLNPTDVVWPEMDAKKEAMEAYRKQLQAEKQKAMDAVMLDASAQEALKAFEEA